MCKTISWIISNAKGIYVLCGIAIAIALWFFTINGLPARLDRDEARVEQLERDVAELKTSMVQQNTKLDLVVTAVYEIRAVLLKVK